MEIREERAEDRDGIRVVNRAAFAGELEAALVEALRDGGHVVTSVVAVDDGHVVGHALFSTLPIDAPNGVIEGAALAPVAVLPARQLEGVGSQIVRWGITRCRELGVAAIVVLGHPAYYPRFGFSAALAERLTAPYAGPALMALELKPGALDGGGTVRYAPPFADLE